MEKISLKEFNNLVELVCLKDKKGDNKIVVGAEQINSDEFDLVVSSKKMLVKKRYKGQSLDEDNLGEYFKTKDSSMFDKYSCDISAYKQSLTNSIFHHLESGDNISIPYEVIEQVANTKGEKVALFGSDNDMLSITIGGETKNLDVKNDIGEMSFFIGVLKSLLGLVKRGADIDFKVNQKENIFLVKGDNVEIVGLFAS